MAADPTRGGGNLLLWAGVVLFALAMLSAMSVAVVTFGTNQRPDPGSAPEPPSVAVTFELTAVSPQDDSDYLG